MAPSKTLHLAAHVFGWLLFFSLMLGFMASFRQGAGGTGQLLSPGFLLFCAIYMALFYCNSYLLIPRLYLQRQTVLYFLILVLLFIVVALLKPFELLELHRPPRAEGFRPPPFRGPARPHRPKPAIDIVGIVLFLMVWSFGFALQVTRQWRTTERRAAQAEADRALTELSFLKAQINPHFLFNTLNNIYSLSLMKQAAAPEAILKLSHIMRYLTDEAGQDYVPLEGELQCITNYIDLQRLRLNEKSRIDFSAEAEPGNRTIAPLILMTFIENVFKYGISSHAPSTITIRITTAGRNLSFFCQNTLFGNQEGNGRAGIGIQNTRKRLNHLYPGRHVLDISTENGLFTVSLHLQL